MKKPDISETLKTEHFYDNILKYKTNVFQNVNRI